MTPKTELGLIKDRFWAKVGDEDRNGCRIWNGTRTKEGYGTFSVFGGRILAHRLSYMFENGEIPDGMLVRHFCDIPPCVNPEHLDVGSHTDNTYDMLSRGRGLVGENSPTAKLTYEDVLKIRRHKKRGTPMRYLVAEFKVHPDTINNAARGRTWKKPAPDACINCVIEHVVSSASAVSPFRVVKVINPLISRRKRVESRGVEPLTSALPVLSPRRKDSLESHSSVEDDGVHQMCSGGEPGGKPVAVPPKPPRDWLTEIRKLIGESCAKSTGAK